MRLRFLELPVEGTPSGHLVPDEPMSPANAKSPTEPHEEKAEEAVDLEINEPPEKKTKVSMKEEMRLLMEKVREGFCLTSAALDKVQQHLDINRQNSSDLAQRAQDVHHDKVSAKYSLAQLQAMLTCFQNIEWQTSGNKADANTSLKAVANKSLAQTTMINQHLKTIHTEIKDGNEKLLKAVADGFSLLASAFAAAEISAKEPEGIVPPNPVPAGVTPLTPASAGGMPAVPEMPPTPMGSVPSYGQPGYATTNPGVGSSSASGFPPGMPTGVMAAGPQPRQALRILVKDEGGRTVPIPVAPTANPPGARLDPNYMSEFGMGFVQFRGNFHRKLPMHFLRLRPRERICVDSKFCWYAASER